MTAPDQTPALPWWLRRLREAVRERDRLRQHLRSMRRDINKGVYLEVFDPEAKARMVAAAVAEEREACAVIRGELLDEVDARKPGRDIDEVAYLRGKAVGIMVYYHAIRARSGGGSG